MSPVVVKIVKCHGFSAEILTTPSPTSARAWGAAKSKAKAAATTSRPQATGLDWTDSTVSTDSTNIYGMTEPNSPMQTKPFLLDDPC